MDLHQAGMIESSASLLIAGSGVATSGQIYDGIIYED